MLLAAGRKLACIALYPKTSRHFGVDSNMTSLLPPSEQEDTVSQFFQVHPENPQARLIKQAAEIIKAGGLVVYRPTRPMRWVARLATRTPSSVFAACASWTTSTTSP